MKNKKRRIIFDGLIILASIIVAIGLSQSPYIETLVSWSKGCYAVASFAAGIFFTSAFTTAPAIAVLAKLTLTYNPFVVALFGATGALLGDLIIFSFIKNHIREDIAYFLSKAKSKRIRHILEHRFARWSLAFLGAIVIASPLPDELGLALMGLSNVRTSRFALVSFSFNAIGILFIAFIARSI